MVESVRVEGKPKTLIRPCGPSPQCDASGEKKAKSKPAGEACHRQSFR